MSNTKVKACCDNDKITEVDKYLKLQLIDTKILNNILTYCCANNKMEIIKWLIKKYSAKFELKYDQAFKAAATNKQHNIIKHLLTTMLNECHEFDNLFGYCCTNNLLDYAKEIYNIGEISVTDIYNKKTKKIKYCGLIKHDDIITYLNDLLKMEDINEKFLHLCIVEDYPIMVKKQSI